MNVNSIYKAQGIATRVYKFHIGTYSYPLHYCKRGRESTRDITYQDIFRNNI